MCYLVDQLCSIFQVNPSKLSHVSTPIIPNQFSVESIHSLFSSYQSMASNERSFVLWLHGLGDSGLANERFLKDQFMVPELAGTKWAFPTAPSAPVTCNGT